MNISRILAELLNGLGGSTCSGGVCTDAAANAVNTAAETVCSTGGDPALTTIFSMICRLFGLGC